MLIVPNYIQLLYKFDCCCSIHGGALKKQNPTFKDGKIL